MAWRLSHPRRVRAPHRNRCHPRARTFSREPRPPAVAPGAFSADVVLEQWGNDVGARRWGQEWNNKEIHGLRATLPERVGAPRTYGVVNAHEVAPRACSDTDWGPHRSQVAP